MILKPNTEAEFLDEIQTKVLRVFLLAIHSHLNCIALRFLFLRTQPTSYVYLHTHATFYVFLQFSYCKLEGEGGKPDRKLYPLHCGLRKKPQVWELSRLCPETSTKLYVHEFGFRRGRTACRKGCIKNTYSDMNVYLGWRVKYGRIAQPKRVVFDRSLKL